MTEEGSEPRVGTSSEGGSGRFQALAAAVDGCVFEVDASGRIAGVDDEFLYRTGREREDVVGTRAADLFEDVTGGLADRFVDTGFEGADVEEAGPLAATVTTPAGERVSGQVRLQSVGGDEEQSDVVGVFEPSVGGVRAHERRRQTLEALHAAASDEAQSIDERIEAVLDVVYDELATDYATLSRVTDDEYRFEVVRTPKEVDIEPGTIVDPESLPVCSSVVETEQSMALRDVAAEAPELTDPEWGIASYVGAPVVVDGDVYGTFCFYGTEPADEAFTDWETTLVDLAAAWVSEELERKRTRAALDEQSVAAEATRRRYETLVENFQNGAVGLVDEDLRYTTVGGTPLTEGDQVSEDLAGRRVSEVLSDDLAAAMVPKYRAALEGDAETFEREVGDRVVQFRTFPVRDDDGDIVAAMGMTQDITEQTERERELSRYESLVEAVNEGIYVVDDDYRYTTVNDAFVELSGYSREELLGEHASIVVDDSTLDSAAEIRAEGDDGMPSLETTMIRADGTEIPVEVTFTSLETDEGSKRVGVVRDISARRESERQLSALMDNVPGMVYRCRNEPGWPMEFVSEGCEELTGYDNEQLVGGAVSFGDDVVLDEDQDDLWDDVQRGLESDGSFLVSYRIETPDGEIRWVRERGRGIYDEDGTLTELEGVIIDITERKRLETELEEILGRVTDAFYALDDEFRFTHVNDRAEELLQATEDELLGEQLWEMYPESAEIDDVWDAFHDAMETQEPQSYELYYEPLDFRIEATVHPSDTGVSVYFRDITERYEQRRQLEESERRYRALVESFPNGAVGLFNEELEYTAVGGELVENRDVEASDRIGRSVFEIYPDDIVDEVEPHFRAALDGETRSFDVEYQGMHLTAEALPIRDSDGNVDAGMLVVQDVTERKKREQQLERTLDLLEKTERIADVGGWEVDAETMDVFWSDQLFDILGVEADEEPPLDEALDVYHEEDRSIVEEAVERALESGESFETEVRFRRPSGEIRWLRLQGAPETDDGEVVAVRGAAQDVTERKEREQFLEDAKAQMEAAAEAGAVGTWEWHIPEDRFVADAALADQFDVDPDAAREGVPLERVTSSIHPDDRDQVQAAIERAIERCGDYEQEYRVTNADGEVRWVVARGHVECDDDGNPTTFPGALTDITDQKRVEQQVKRQRKELETLFDVLPVGVVVANSDGEIVEANEEAREVWGGDVFEASSLEEYERYDVWWEDTGERVEPGELTMARVLRGDAVEDPDIFDIEGTDGIRRTIMVHGMPVFDDAGDVDRGVITLTDITERREYQRKLEASNERLEQFAYAASHDLQEPLRMVSSYLSLIADRYEEELDEDGEEFIEYAVDGAERMQEMINALLEYSRVQTEGEAFEPVDLDAVFEDVRRDYELRIEETNATVESEPLPTVQGDEDQLRQVFGNLLSNALEYSGDEPPAVSVTAERDGNEWVVGVHDEGIGIAEEHVDRIFEVFQHLHSQDEHSGTGIGLALAQRVVERHGGDIWVESEPGEGSTFYFSISESEEGHD